ncbi:MAG: ABC transporter ATP-binding protein [Ignavibacteriae bacterium]|nr:ABC transporter ATP-binding protein [Ignavibacteriota bacterium]
MNDPILTTRDVCKSYASGTSAQAVLRDVSFSLQRGSITAIVGVSGAGKSTLLHILGTLDRPDSGSVTLAGTDVFGLPDTELARFRNRHLGFVFQFHHLLPEFTALENVFLPSLIAGETRQRAEQRAMDLLARVKVDHRAHARPAQLSGGEQQRVAVARALVNEPDLVLADEPSGNLDEENAAALHELIRGLSRESGRSFVIVTHDETLAGMADDVYRLHDGALARRQSTAKNS